MTTNDKLKDIAYKIATRNLTTKELSFKQFNRCNMSNIVWEPLEHLDINEYASLITALSEDIYSQLSKVHNKEDTYATTDES